MRAIVKDKNSLGVQNIPAPLLGADTDVIIEVKLAGLCRTDVFVAEGRIPCKESLVLGHEFSGVVVQAGSDADFSQGDRVTAMPVLPCFACERCEAGRADQCQKTTMLGIDVDGAFGERIAVPATAVYKIPDDMSYRLAAYAEPVAAALSVMKSGIEKSQRGVIYGDNRFSHLILRILRAYDFKNVSIHDPKTAVLADSRYDFAVETLAANQTMSELMTAVKPGGRIVLKSRKHEPVGICFAEAVRKEITFTAVNYGEFGEAIRLMAEGLITVDDLLGEEYGLDDYATVFERSKTLETRKVFFNPEK
ncbi:MAG: zinc-binding dehydrogenase [Alphaproteobacteria bacterium]